MPLFILLGNTTIKARFEAAASRVYPLSDTAAAVDAVLATAAGHGIIAASVNPSLKDALARACREKGLTLPRYAGRDFSTGVEMAVENPSLVGIDRVLNVKAAFAGCSRAVVAVDFGTAVSISVADGQGRFIGGAIFAGIGLSLRALRQNTALLPEVSPSVPANALGKNTANAMTSGCVLGAIGAAREIIARVSASMKGPLDVVVTGGDAALVEKAGLPEGWIVSPDLTLDGLRLAYDEAG